MASVPDASPKTTSDRPVTIYALLEPHAIVGDGLPKADVTRYVGKSIQTTKRYAVHIRARTETYRDRWIRQLRRMGLRPVMVEIETVSAGADWVTRERYWIAHYRNIGARLTNLTDGGEGIIGLPLEILALRNARIRATHSLPEARARSATMAREIMQRPGVKDAIAAHTRTRWQNSEYKARTGASIRKALSRPEWSAAQSARMKGHTHRPESIAKMSATKRGVPKSAAHRAKLSAALMGRTLPPEHAARISAGLTVAYTNADLRARITEINRANLAKPVVKEKLRKATTARYGRPGEREKTAETSRATGKHPDVIEKRRTAMQRLLSDPEQLAKFSGNLRAARENPRIETKRRLHAAEASKREDVRGKKSTAMIAVYERDDEARARQSRNTATLWADPIWKANMLAARAEARERKKVERLALPL